MSFQVDKLRDDFFQSEVNTDVDILEALSKHFRSHSGDGSGGSWFSITPNAARWMLHNLKHEKCSTEEENSVFFITKLFNEGNGLKGSTPKKPIQIDATTNTILHGRKRLMGLALSEKCKGTFLEIEIS